ncbi:hypothetical protein EJ04DRAFT_535270 [Polyplosphaeria fusca]|uniref:non-specific serine/threonine protein kinase n=1 Tax=Polyplosphaeria fusca TaxID=682080 RepID=A0A9P4V263_9PLEO|nr:hypothetical protein EJ04DRAFT_535270 [Polyplosphaeria fusca]
MPPTKPKTRKQTTQRPPKKEVVVTTVELEDQLEALTLEAKPVPGSVEPLKDERKPRKPMGYETFGDEPRKEGETCANKVQQAADKNLSTPIQKTRGRPKKTIPTQLPHMNQLPTPEPSPGPEDIYTAYVKPLVELSDRRTIVPFTQWTDELDPYFEITKIAEASFSEVYRLTTKSTMPGLAQESVLKLIALRTPPDAPLPSETNPGGRSRGRTDATQQLERERADREENDSWKSEVDDVQGEVRLLQNLNHIPGFTNFRELTLLQGRPTSSFNRAWREWNKSRPRGKKSVFPDPTKKASYDDNQLWAVVEMQDAGTDCEKVMDKGGLSNIWEVWDVIWGVCLSVAKAEEGCRFEHRDLHLENVCIRANGNVHQTIVKNPLKRKLGFTGLETTVIDYTLSRADIIPPSSPKHRFSSSSADSCFSTTSPFSSLSAQAPDIAYLDLNKDQGLFQGDASEEYQYEIYRYMRSVAYHGDPLAQYRDRENEEQEERVYTTETPRRSPRKPKPPRRRDNEHIWKSFFPKTNLLWVHFILYKLLEHVEAWGNVPEHLSPQDVTRSVVGDAEANKVHKKAQRLFKILRKVEMLIEPGVLGREGSLGSVKELVVLALEKGWLDPEDVVGREEEEEEEDEG